MVLADTAIVYDHTFHPKYSVTTGEQIQRIFTANLLGNGHEQLVMVTLNTVHTGGQRGTIYATYVYDFATGMAPIWADTTNFEAQYAVDLQKAGYDQLLGWGAKSIGSNEQSCTLIDPKNNFQTVWSFGDASWHPTRIAGPFVDNTMLNTALLPGDLRKLAPTDVNGDGTLDVCIDGTNPNLLNARQCLVIDAHKNVLDTIAGLGTAPFSSGLFALGINCVSYDLNNNGAAELLFTETASGPDNGMMAFRGSVWDWNAPASAVASQSQPKTGSLAVYPNPCSTRASISFCASDEESYQLRLLNVAGVAVREASGRLHIGENAIELTRGDLADGVYFVELLHAGHAEHGMISVQR